MRWKSKFCYKTWFVQHTDLISVSMPSKLGCQRLNFCTELSTARARPLSTRNKSSIFEHSECV